MIHNETLFILGAGASSPYGYPIGNELRHKICKEFPLIYGNLLDQGAPPDLHSIKKEAILFGQEFAAAFFLSSTPSIDLFLARNPNFLEIGRKAIALIILNAEKDSCFREDVDHKQDWYSYLYQRMTEKLTKYHDYRMIDKNKISFITFNYDRSLEFFLYVSLSNSFSATLFSSHHNSHLIPFQFNHVHGKIANLPWEGEKILDYALEPTTSILENIYKNIFVIFENKNSKNEIIKEQISKAKRIFFLGFGFAEENLEVLSMPEILINQQKIYGTALGKTKKEIEDLKLLLGQNSKNKGPSRRNLIIEDMNCYELLREYL